MGKVALTFRILPDSTEVDLNQLVGVIQTHLPKGAKWNGFKTTPFAYGLTAIQCAIIIEDAEGGADNVQEALEKVEQVQGVELIDMGRLM